MQDRRVAVKVFSSEFVATFGRRDIEQEARIAGRLEHPNVVGVRNADWAGERFILVTDLALRSLEGYFAGGPVDPPKPGTRGPQS